MVAFYRDTLGLSVMREVDSVEGDHTGIPGARRTLVFVGKPEGEHALGLRLPVLRDTCTGTSSGRLTFAST